MMALLWGGSSLIHVHIRTWKGAVGGMCHLYHIQQCVVVLKCPRYHGYISSLS